MSASSDTRRTDRLVAGTGVTGTGVTSTVGSGSVVASQVEPRIVERRRSVQRDARRRRTRLLTGMGVLLGLIVAAVGSTMSPLLDVDRVTVVGADHVSQSDLLSAGGVDHGDRLIDLDLQAARRSIMAMPWVASARVVRDWPDAVRISVTEERPAASVVTGRSVVLVSTTGRVLERRSEPQPGYPRLVVDGPLELTDRSGTTASDPVGAVVSRRLQNALGLFERMSPDLRGELSLATVADDGTISFELSDGAVVRFGPPESVAAKLLAVQAVLSQVVRDCMATLDVREPTRPSVSRGPGCPGISPSPASSGSSGTGSSGSGTGPGSGSGSGSASGSSKDSSGDSSTATSTPAARNTGAVTSASTSRGATGKAGNQ